MPPGLGILAFLLVVAVMLAAAFALSRRYGRGATRQLADITRENALRDGNLTYPGTAGLPPYFGNEEPSPRERLKGPPE